MLKLPRGLTGPQLSIVGLFLLAVAVLGLALALTLGIKAAEDGQAALDSPPVRLDEAYGRLPLSFEANQGQADQRVQFLSRGRGYTLFLTPAEAVFALRSLERQSGDKGALPGEEGPKTRVAALRLKLVGANPDPTVAGLDELPGKLNYFIGNDPERWRTDIPIYGKVSYREVYPGIDLVYYGNQRQLEHDLVVNPGADPGVIVVAFMGAKRLRIDRNGDLVLQVPMAGWCCAGPSSTRRWTA